MAGGERVDEERLVLALAGAVVVKIGQAVEGEPRFGPLSGFRPSRRLCASACAAAMAAVVSGVTVTLTP